ncbi:MAG: hypothetical protein QG630_281 [Patescibacteria group bacterium]|nr:hypothetical protein [Patescibacteria group bacterium]
MIYKFIKYFYFFTKNFFELSTNFFKKLLYNFFLNEIIILREADRRSKVKN